MKRRAWVVTLSLVAVAGLVVGVANADPKPVQLADAKVIVEVNATDGDAGLQIFLDGGPWRQMAVFRPDPPASDGQKIAEFGTAGPVNEFGLTELFSESSEPPFTEFPLEQFKALFPEGIYSFSGTTIDGAQLTGTATLTHDIPNGPEILAPEDGARLARDHAVLEWDEGDQPAGVEIVGYQVVVTRESPLRILSADLPATVTSFTIPAEFLDRNVRYKFEILAIDAGGNQTLTEQSFVAR